MSLLQHPIMHGIVLAAILAAASMAANSASKADVVDALAAHGAHPHKPTEQRLVKLEGADGAQNEKLAKLEGVESDVRGIRARIDMLLLREIDDAKRSPQRRARLGRSAAKVRSDARKRGESGDPLAGIEGL